MQAKPLAQLNRVTAVVKHAVEPFVQVRNVIAAIEIIIDKYFPVTGERIAPPFEPSKRRKTQRLNLAHQIESEKLPQLALGLARG